MAKNLNSSIKNETMAKNEEQLYPFRFGSMPNLSNRT